MTQIGDAVLNFTANTEDLEKSMNKLFDRIERTAQAARAAWNAKKVEDCGKIVGKSVDFRRDY